MEKSQEIKQIAAALVAFQKSAPKVSKDAKANYGKYATLENVVDTIREPLSSHGLGYAQFPDGDGLTTIIVHTSGEWISSTAKLTMDKQTPQGQGSAITYMRRYALSAALGLATEDDDDGDLASKPPVAAKPAAPKKVEDARAAKKKLIAELLKKRATDPLVPMETKAQYEEACRQETGLELNDENIDAILEILNK